MQQGAHHRFSAENSLSHLQTDYLDVLLLHRPSPLMQVEEIAAAFSLLKSKGKVKSFGVSNFTPSQIQYLQKEVDLEWNQIECSLSHNQPLFDGSLDFSPQRKHRQYGVESFGGLFQGRQPNQSATTAPLPRALRNV